MRIDHARLPAGEHFALYPVVLELAASLGPYYKELDRHDKTLARKCANALASAALNLAGASYNNSGKTTQARYQIVLSALREVLVCFELALAFGYVQPLPRETTHRFHHVLEILARLTTQTH